MCHMAPLILMAIVYVGNVVECGMMERHLIYKLLENYNKLERPVNNESAPLNVTFSITLQQIIDVDEKNQILVSNIWLNIKWVDANLQWNPALYGDIKSIRIAPDRIWIPDVLLYNSADERFDSTFRTNVVVESDGSMLFVPPGIFKSTCRIDITWFPFDDQMCDMKFGTWTHDGLAVDIYPEMETADISPYIQNSEWVLVSVPSKKHVLYYECCPEPYMDITYKVHIKRRTLYYGFNLIIPCIILSSMTLLSFSLPPESGEKLHLGVTILLSMTVFLVQLGKILPATSDSVSIIALYFGFIMVMVAFSVVMTVVVLNFHHRSSETKEMGPKLRSLLLNWLPRIIGMDRPGIKPPKQCIQKKPSKTSLVASKIICGSKSPNNSNGNNHQMNRTESVRGVHQQQLSPMSEDSFGNFVPQGPTNEPIVAPIQGASELCIGLDMFDDSSLTATLPIGLATINNVGIPNENVPNRNENHAHFGLYDHEIDCIFAANNNNNNKMDSRPMSAMKETIIEQNTCAQQNDEDDDEEEEEEGEDVEEDAGNEVIDENSQLQEDDLDLSVSITESSSVTKVAKNLDKIKLLKNGKMNNSSNNLNRNKNGSIKSKSTPSKAKCKQQQKKRCQSQSSINGGCKHDQTHLLHHEYMAMKRKQKLLEILLEMRFITDRLRQEDATKELIGEWRYAATVLDRLCLILFTFFTILSLVVCLGSAPQLIV